ncbi:hypothetical protein ABTM70_18910, partial [Acinetobacter baumannii]
VLSHAPHDRTQPPVLPPSVSPNQNLPGGLIGMATDEVVGAGVVSRGFSGEQLEYFNREPWILG